MRLIPARIAPRVISSALAIAALGCEAQAAEQRVGERAEAALLEHGEGEGEGESLATAAREEPDPGIATQEREEVEVVADQAEFCVRERAREIRVRERRFLARGAGEGLRCRARRPSG